MHPKSPKWLDDVVRACQHIEEYTDGFALEDYQGDRLVRAAVERNLMIIGESLQWLERVDPPTAKRMAGLEQVIAVGQQLVYEPGKDIDDAEIWIAIQDFIPTLRIEVVELLAEAESSYEGRPS